MTPRPTTLTFTPWAVLYPTTTTPADAGANPRTGPWGANARGPWARGGAIFRIAKFSFSAQSKGRVLLVNAFYATNGTQTIIFRIFVSMNPPIIRDAL